MNSRLANPAYCTLTAFADTAPSLQLSPNMMLHDAASVSYPFRYVLNQQLSPHRKYVRSGQFQHLMIEVRIFVQSCCTFENENDLPTLSVTPSHQALVRLSPWQQQHCSA
ncbi:hypothetical protein ABVT39_004497 [Epinephelus coioides]